jgi:3-polyprenyl-4-hydroxybenzoate decarboxylase
MKRDAMSALGQKRTLLTYSITSLACASSAGGTVMPSALAVYYRPKADIVVG